MKELSTITIAMMKDKVAPTWLAQIHVEYKGVEGKQVLPLSGESDPIQLLRRCVDEMDKKMKSANGKSFLR